MPAERIRGGWPNVPDNLKTKTMLSQEGLKPTGEPVAEVWGGRQWVHLYDMAATVAKRKPSEKQRAALDKARELARAKYNAEHTCSECKTICKPSELHPQSDDTKTCKHCIERMQWENHFESMVAEGQELFKKWYDQDFVILDVETTDLYGEIVQVGIIDRTGIPLFDSLVKPIQPVPDDSPATLIHGITNDQLAEAPTWAAIWGDVLAILEGKVILAFNAAFDEAMVRNSCQRNQIEYPGRLKWECVMEAYRLTEGSERWISLERASGWYTKHRAIDDCIATLRVIRSQWADLGLLSEESA